MRDELRATDEGEYANLVSALIDVGALDLRRAAGRPAEVRVALCRYLKRGKQSGLSTGELVDFLGVSSPSLVERAGFSDSDAQELIQLLAELEDSEIDAAAVPPAVVERAFRHFRASAASFGATIEESLSTLATPLDRIAVGRVRNAAIRLSWRSADQATVLEVSQGPPAGPAVGWLELERVSLVDDGAMNDAEAELAAGIEYGFELMAPSR